MISKVLQEKWNTVSIPIKDLGFAYETGAKDPNKKLDCEKIKWISIGMNTKAKDNALEISDLYFARE